jgi:Ca2+-binding EF-hand superfamily protein
MGGRSCKPVIEFTDALHSLSPDVVNDLTVSFQRLQVDNRIAKDMYVTHQLVPRFGRFSNRALLERVFCVVDCNGSGFIEFEEFTIAHFVWTHGSRDHKLKCTFFHIN